MKHKQKREQFSVRMYSHLLILTAILFLGTNSKVFASGAKLPDIASNNLNGTQNVSAPNSSNQPVNTPQKEIGTILPIADKYAHLDPGKEVPSTLLSRALSYFDSHSSTIKNKNVIGIIDFKQHSSKERFYIIDLDTGQVDKYLVAHGKNSDPDYDGFATIFSNAPGSETSSIGFYLTAETYEGGHGYSLALDGISSTNSNARSRSIVIHPADYVTPGDKIGRSWGCPALEPRYSAQIIDQIKGGALIYASNVY